MTVKPWDVGIQIDFSTCLYIFGMAWNDQADNLIKIYIYTYHNDMFLLGIYTHPVYINK